MGQRAAIVRADLDPLASRGQENTGLIVAAAVGGALHYPCLSLPAV
jgi:hypothetical protein